MEFPSRTTRSDPFLCSILFRKKRAVGNQNQARLQSKKETLLQMCATSREGAVSWCCTLIFFVLAQVEDPRIIFGNPYATKNPRRTCLFNVCCMLRFASFGLCCDARRQGVTDESLEVNSTWRNSKFCSRGREQRIFLE